MIDVQGHRGARGYLPENTLPSFALALEMGVTTLELDVAVTRDGVVVIHHDRGLNPAIARLEGQWVARPTPIHSLSFAELQRYDVGRLRPGSEYGRAFPHQEPRDGTRIPRLAELFQLTQANRTIRFNIEPKMDESALDETLPAPEFARALIAEVRKAGVQNRTSVQAFHWPVLKVVEREAPEMPTVYCTEGEGSDPARVREAGGKIWSPDFEQVTAAKLKQARAWDMRVTVWTVNEPADIARMIALGVDGIASDYPDRVLKQVKGK